MTNISEATKTIQTIEQGKNKKLLSLIPEGQSPKLYLDLIKSQVMKTDKNGKPRNDEDFLLFLYTCKRTQLDPLTRQIYAVFRWDYKQGKEVMTIQASIDGMRLVAQRTGNYAGQDDIKYTPEDEVSQYPIKATATVYKVIKGARVPFAASARWGEYVQYFKKDGNNVISPMWAKMPYNQLGKCAEALALRKGFPNELSGIYSEEEMQQAESPIASLPTPDKFKVEVIHGAPVTEQVSNPPNVEIKVEPKAEKEVEVEKPKSIADIRNENKAQQDATNK